MPLAILLSYIGLSDSGSAFQNSGSTLVISILHYSSFWQYKAIAIAVLTVVSVATGKDDSV
jgi:hypothetical protein